MASTIVTKNSSTASAVPVAGDLTKGELAVNVTDKKLYTKDNGGSVVKLVGSLGNQEASAVAITGGAIDGTAIGGTTTAAGAFTTLAASSSVTLSGGTANGVAYLNGSKVVTSGSALTFDGTKFLNQLTAPPTGWSGIGASYWVKQSAADGGYYAIASSSDAGIFMGHNGTVGKLGVSYGATAGYTPLAFFTNDSEQMRLTSTGLGIGTSSPQVQLHLQSDAPVIRLTDTTANTNAEIFCNSAAGSMYLRADKDNTAANSVIGFQIDGSDKMTLDSSGNVGIGTSSPAGPLEVIGTNGVFITRSTKTANTNTGARFMGGAYTGNPATFALLDGISGQNQLNIGGGTGVGEPATSIRFYTGTAGSLGAGTERARIDSSGNLLLGTTSTPSGSSDGFVVFPAGTVAAYRSGAAPAVFSRNAASGDVVVIQLSGTTVGSISASGSTTSYNTSSDYRLKDNIAPMTGALEKVAALKPVTYKWKADGSDGEGFIAHELAEVCPQAVTGEKDAVDENGNPKYQGIDTSFLVATLTAAIKELKSELDSVKAELATLKG